MNILTKQARIARFPIINITVNAMFPILFCFMVILYYTNIKQNCYKKYGKNTLIVIAIKVIKPPKKIIFNSILPTFFNVLSSM